MTILLTCYHLYSRTLKEGSLLLRHKVLIIAVLLNLHALRQYTIIQLFSTLILQNK